MLRRFFSLQVIATAILFIGIAPVSADQPAKKLPALDAAALAATSKTIADVYKNDLDAAKTPEQKAKLAAKMFDDASNTRDDIAARFALFRAARKLATAGGDLDLALRSVERLATEYEVDALAMRRDIVAEVAPLGRNADDQYLIVRLARRELRAAARADRYDLAAPLADLALAAAKKLADKDVLKQCEEEKKRIESAASEFEKTKQALAVMETKPAEPAANLTAGKYYCFVQGNWEKGLNMLALCGDAELKAIAIREIREPTDPKEQILLGDLWYDFAQKQDAPLKPKLLSRAGYWYRRGQTSLDGLNRVRVNKRLVEIDAATSPFPMGEWVELLEFIESPQKQSAGKARWRGVSIWFDEGGPSEAEKYRSILMPIVVEGSYELALRASRDGKDELLSLWAAAADRSGHVRLNYGTSSGIWRVNGKNGDEDANPSKVKLAPVKPGIPYTIIYKVEIRGEAVAINVLFDGKPYISWKGRMAELDKLGADAIGRIGVGNVSRPISFHAIRFKLTSGTARLVE